MLRVNLKKTSCFLAGAIALSILATSPAFSQVRSQFQELGKEEEQNAPTVRKETLIDHREEMRRFIQNIARFARKYNRNFVVLVKDGNKLLQTVVDPENQTVAPNTTYIKAIDGIMQSGLSFGNVAFGEATDPDIQADMLAKIKVAKDNRLPVFILDYVAKPSDVDKSFALATSKGFIPYAAPGKDLGINAFAKWPKRPLKETANSVTSLGQVNNFMIMRDSTLFGSRDAFAMDVHNTNYDMVIVDVFHKRLEPLNKQNINTIQYKKLGARRLTLAYMNIGTANSSAYYWQDDWSQGNPSWLNETEPGHTDEHIVQFWDPRWQQIFYGDPKSYVYGIVKQGYDGVLIDGADAHLFFESPDE